MLKNMPNNIREVFSYHRFLRAISGLFLMTLFTKFIGYAEKIIVAYYFGTGDETDVYQAVFTLITVVFLITREFIEPGCMNMFVRLAQEDEKEVWKYFNFIFRGVFFLSLLIVLWGTFFPTQVVATFTPGFGGMKRQLAIRFVQISFLGLIFYCVSAVTNVALNAAKKFVYPVLGDIALKLSVLCSLFVLQAKVGIISLAYGIAIGCLLRLFVHLLSLKKYLSFSWISLRAEYLPSLRKYFLPVLIGVAFSQCIILLNNIWLSGMGKGEIAAIGFATKLIDFPVVIVSYTLGVVIFPYFTHMQSSGGHNNAVQLLSVINILLLTLFLPLTCILFTYGWEVIEIVFKRGSFDAHSVMQTYRPLLVLTFAIIPMALESVIVLYFFSSGNILTAVVTGMACSLLSLLITYFTIDHLGYIAVPIGFVISRYVKTLLLSIILWRKGSFHIPMIIIGKVFAGSLLFVILLCCIKQSDFNLFLDSHRVLLPVVVIVVSVIYCAFLHIMKLHIYFRDVYLTLRLKYL